MITKKITIASGKVSGTHTDFPVYLKPSAMTGWTTLTTAEAESMRAYSDAGLTTELAIEVVSNDEIHIKVPSLSSSSEIYVTYDGIRSLYAFTDTYGRNAVWSDYLGVYHLEGNGTSSTGNYNATQNSVSYGTADGKLAGQYGSYNGTSSRSDLANAAMPTGGNARTIQGWFRPDSTTFDTIWSQGTQTGTRSRLMFHINFSGTGGDNTGHMYLDLGSDFTSYTTNHISANTWYKIDVTYAGGAHNTNLKYYNNGSNIAMSHGTANALNTNAGNVAFGGDRPYNTRFFGGYIDEFRTRAGALSANWLTTEYNNQNDVATFWGTVTDAGGAPVANNGFMVWL